MRMHATWVVLAVLGGAAACGPAEPPVVATVETEENGGSLHVRQGYGPIRLRVSGEHLAGTEVEAWVGRRGGAGELSARVAEVHADGLLEVEVEVAHGAPLGPVTLLLRNARGEVEAPALSVHPITVAQNGLDAAAGGTPAHPFRTVTHALAHAGRGDEVRVQPGTYDANSGETWLTSLVFGARLIGEKVDGQEEPGVVLAGSEGQSQGGLILGDGAEVENLRLTGFHEALTVLQGASAKVSSLLVEGNHGSGLLAADAGALEVHHSRMLNNAGLCLYASAPRVFLDDVECAGNGRGLEVQADEARLLHARASANPEDNYVLVGNTVSVEGGYARGPGTRIHARGSLNLEFPTLQDVEQLRVDGPLTMRRGTVDFGPLGGLELASGAGAPVSTITGAAITGRGAPAVVVQGGALKVRESNVSHLSGVVFQLNGGTLDLGNAGESGENTLWNDFHAPVLHDARPAGSGRGITLRGTSVGGSVPSARSVSGPVSEEGMVRIDGEGNEALFL